jgi:hypothetical protein
MLHISCPKCRSVLSLDPGFRGMMCRCSVCGSILNVPQDPGRSVVKIVQSGSTGDGSSMSGSSASGSRRPESPMSDIWNGGTPRPMPMLNTGSDSVSTPSDTLVRMNSGKPSSGNSKQMVIISAALGAPTLVAILGILLLVMMKSGDDNRNAQASVMPSASLAPTAPPTPAPAPVYTPTPTPAPVYTPVPVVTTPALSVSPDNPWGLTSSNVMGLGITGQTVVVFDAVEQSAPWFDAMNRLVRDGLAKPSPAQAAVVYISDGKAQDTGMVMTGTTLSGRLTGLQRSIRPVGRSGFWNGIDAAMALQPTQVILVTGRTSWSSSIPTFESKLKLRGQTVPLHVVGMVGANADLEGLTRRTGGRYIPSSTAQLSGWLNEADRAGLTRP